MALTYKGTLEDLRLQLVADLVDGLTPAAATGSRTAGKIVVGTSALAGGATGKLLEFTLPTPAFVVLGGAMTLQGVPLNSTATAAGKAALAEIRNNAGDVIVSGLKVGILDAQVIVASVNIKVGDAVALTALTIDHG